MTPNITTHFTVDEVTDSEYAERHGIDNSYPEDLAPAILNTAGRMEHVRKLLEELPIKITSWYRCAELNKAIGSKSKNSQHISGEAVDFKCSSYGTPVEIVKTLFGYRYVLNFDQVILEHSWVHISFLSNPSAVPRLEVLSLLHTGGYASGITNKFGVPL